MHRGLMACFSHLRRAMYDRVRAQLGGTAGGAPKPKPRPAPKPTAAPALQDDGRELIDSLANWKWSS